MSAPAWPRDPSHGTGGSSTGRPRTPSFLLVPSAGPAAETVSSTPDVRGSSGTRSSPIHGHLSGHTVPAAKIPISVLRDLDRLRSARHAKPCSSVHDRFLPRFVSLHSPVTVSYGRDRVMPPPCSDIRSAKPVSTATAYSLACFLPPRETAFPPLPVTGSSLPSEPSPGRLRRSYFHRRCLR